MERVEINVHEGEPRNSVRDTTGALVKGKSKRSCFVACNFLFALKLRTLGLGETKIKIHKHKQKAFTPSFKFNFNEIVTIQPKAK